MSLTITITSQLADQDGVALARAADLAGMPFRFEPARRRQPGRILLLDLDQDPSIGSETLDNSAAWPQSEDVQAWLERALRWLGENVPDGAFILHAGWTEHNPVRREQLTLDELLDHVRGGLLSTTVEYEVMQP